ncbi:histone deacetylase HDT1 [Hevea brasiliensis]|uniref:histone deacetylase HDT1 n=1 Tax=Hevea brasiliensis TaxID=3981 RepID=UPI0025CBC8FC|nr:histone deacetylase HDT1 [Hevea brasiliensis]
MEFWGVEVKAGEPLKVTPDLDRIIHLSQAALGESKKEKGNESVPLFLKIDDKKIVLGSLSPENIPQLSFDLVFEREVELSHNWKSGSVYFCGYQTPLPEEEEIFADEDSEDEGPFPLMNADNGSVQPLIENAKPAKGKPVVAKPDSSAKQKAKPVEPSKESKTEDESEDDESDEDDEEDSSDEEGDSDEEMSEDSEDEGESESEDKETPKKAEKGKKRPNDSATKTPVASKKIKSVTPQKTDGKKGGHTATPHPAKGKAAANGSNAKAQTPKSGGQFACKSCERSFGSDAALQSHSKAKHGGK